MAAGLRQSRNYPFLSHVWMEIVHFYILPLLTCLGTTLEVKTSANQSGALESPASGSLFEAEYNWYVSNVLSKIPFLIAKPSYPKTFVVRLVLDGPVQGGL